MLGLSLVFPLSAIPKDASRRLKPVSSITLPTFKPRTDMMCRILALAHGWSRWSIAIGPDVVAGAAAGVVDADRSQVMKAFRSAFVAFSQAFFNSSSRVLGFFIPTEKIASLIEPNFPA